tara:strand:- start:259499 stop:260200 length:702 start_codon:yes stop_codon:yes gene_type:complete
MDKVAVNTSPIEAIFQASIVVQITLLILIGLSVVCWGIAYNKWQLLKKIKTTNEVFLSYFWKSSSLENLYDDLDKFRDSTLAHVFKSAYVEMKKLADSRPGGGNTEGAKPALNNMDNLERVIRKSIENELANMESKLTVLATTGSTGPFVGLFGTVWGIMSSFHKIGTTGNASLAVVAPGISEALVATAIGLAAAIPAVVLYNHFVSTIRKEEIELNNFSADFLNIVKRNFFN